MYLHVSSSEFNSILAGLRLLANVTAEPEKLTLRAEHLSAIGEIASGAGQHPPLTATDINELGDRLNCTDMTPRALVVVSGGCAYVRPSSSEIDIGVWDRDNYESNPFDTEAVPCSLRHLAPEDAPVETQWSYYLLPGRTDEQQVAITDAIDGPLPFVPRAWFASEGILVAVDPTSGRQLINPVVIREHTGGSRVGIAMRPEQGWRYLAIGQSTYSADMSGIVDTGEPDLVCIDRAHWSVISWAA